MSSLRSGMRLLSCAAALTIGLAPALQAQDLQAQEPAATERTGQTEAQPAQTVSPPTTEGLKLELNTASDVDGVCRLAFVAYNGTATALEDLAYEVVAFDAEQRISQFVIFEFGTLPQRKTKIVQFDIANSKCADISRLVINSAARCEAGGSTLPLCLDEARPTSRTSIALGL